MVVKVTGVYLMLSCLLLHVASITEQEFKNYKGYDPTKSCGCSDSMNKECNKLAVAARYTDGKTPQIDGFPQCMPDAKISLDGGSKKTVKVLTCAWYEGRYFVVGKGELENHFMTYDVDGSGVCHPKADMPL